MALLLARRQQRLPSTSSLIRFFSNSSSDPLPQSPFSAIKSSLKQKLSQSQNQSRGSLHDLSTNLAKFQRRSAAPPPKGVSLSPPSVSFETLYKQNVAQSFCRNRKGEAFPTSVSGKEMEDETEEMMMSEFLKVYGDDELGEKLRRLRPEGRKEGGVWFSLEELNERLVKLRQVEEKEVKNSTVLRSVIRTFQNEEAKHEVVSQQIDILGCLDTTPEYKHYPPKDALVETYFHSDNLSSAEKMKVELTKVREEFKMSESDCGSACVQVAQLTTKIKHLSAALDKKDKHSRKGLLAMVLKRKKLLKYLRRTDWDSYCLILSNLGLRDNPDYKF